MLIAAVYVEQRCDINEDLLETFDCFSIQLPNYMYTEWYAAVTVP